MLAIKIVMGSESLLIFPIILPMIFSPYILLPIIIVIADSEPFLPYSYPYFNCDTNDRN